MRESQFTESQILIVGISLTDQSATISEIRDYLARP